MKQKSLVLLITISAISLISLVLFQGYWVKASIAAQQNSFDQHVMETLSQVIRKLEKEEAITQVTSKLFRESDLTATYGADSVLSLEQFQLNDAFKGNSIVKGNSNNNNKDQLQINFTPAKDLDSSIFIIRKTQKRVLGSNLTFSPTEDSGLIKNQLKRRATLVNDIVNELALISISKDFNERIDYGKIDSLLVQELALSGINLDFIFDVFDSESKELSFEHNGEFASELLGSPYKVSLFPNDFYLESDHLILFFPSQSTYVLKGAWKVVSLSVAIFLILSFLLYFSIATIFKQKKLSQVKTDFINNMTHELKTPISTISLACEALQDSNISLDFNNRNKFVEMIEEENSRLSLLVENVLKSAVWDSIELELNIKRVDLHELIEEITSRFQLQINEKNGSISTNLNAKKSILNIDPIHISNLLYNLIDNAIKYSKESPRIEIVTQIIDNKLELEIKDNGIGITQSDLKRIFDKFYRVPTGNIHDVKGFGLGLNYVKRIIDLHNGSIDIKSKIGKGTTIKIKLNTDGRI